MYARTLDRRSQVLVRFHLSILALAACVRADDPCHNALDAIQPAGVQGRLWLCGSETSADSVLNGLRRVASNGDLEVLMIGTQAPPQFSIERLWSAFPHGTLRWVDSWSAFKWKEIPAEGIRVIWLHTDQALPFEEMIRRPFLEWAKSMLANGTMLVVSGPVVSSLCDCIYVLRGSSELPRPGTVLFRDVIWIDETSNLDAAGANLSGLTGTLLLQISPKGILNWEGRQLSTPPEAEAGATIWLPKGRDGLRTPVVIDRDHPADLTLLRRIAVLRGQPSGPQSTRAPDVPHGSLVIVGGGELTDAILERFVALAGGQQAQIVVIPTANEQPVIEDCRDAVRLRRLGVLRVSVLHTHDRATAKSDEFLAPLRDATGVWFTGGRQWRLVDAYEGTPVVGLCHQVLARDGVIGGTSAGATIQGEYLVRGHPFGNEVMMAEGYEQGFGFLPGTAIDQHFTERNRAADLESVKRAHPHLVCLGIDESTALVVSGQQGTVLGRGGVTVFDASTPDSETAPSRPVVLQPGDRYDFGRRSVLSVAD